jgi:hypothetical protein
MEGNREVVRLQGEVIEQQKTGSRGWMSGWATGRGDKVSDEVVDKVSEEVADKGSSNNCEKCRNPSAEDKTAPAPPTVCCCCP